MKTVYAATGTAEDVASGTTLELAKLFEIIISKIPLWIAGFIVILLSVLIAKIARNVVENKMAEKGIEEDHKEIQILAGRVTYVGIIMLGITMGLKIAGIDLTTIIAAAAFGIGFALRDMIMNFLAGVMILLGRHFTIGDFINIGGTIGKVEEIQSRVTIIKAIDGTKVIVPNADLFKKQIISYTSNPFRIIEIKVKVDYRTNLENAIKVCMKAVKETKGVLIEPGPAVLVSQFCESGIELKIRAWVDSKGGWIKIQSHLTTNIKNELDENGITIPWPIRTIAYDKDLEIDEKKMEQTDPSLYEKEESEEKIDKPSILPNQQQPVMQEVENNSESENKVNSRSDSNDEDPPLKPLGEKRM